MFKLNKFGHKLKFLFSKYPCTSNTTVVAVFCVASEISQQALFQDRTKNQSFDTTSTFNYVFCGTLTQGAPLTHWYKWLDSKYPDTTAKTITKKLFLDLGVLNPILLAWFFILLDVMEKRDALESCKTKLIPTIVSSTAFWIPVQAINFFCIPPLFREIKLLLRQLDPQGKGSLSFQEFLYGIRTIIRRRKLYKLWEISGE
ncbi:hypothetical protein FQR65_LT07352 [Abscondita terminalis]|nr:hypothetical protein FQR65_LT07352 [Abscondita terminalis]